MPHLRSMVVVLAVVVMVVTVAMVMVATVMSVPVEAAAKRKLPRLHLRHKHAESDHLVLSHPRAHFHHNWILRVLRICTLGLDLHDGKAHDAPHRLLHALWADLVVHVLRALRRIGKILSCLVTLLHKFHGLLLNVGEVHLVEVFQQSFMGLFAHGNLGHRHLIGLLAFAFPDAVSYRQRHGLHMLDHHAKCHIGVLRHQITHLLYNTRMIRLGCVAAHVLHFGDRVIDDVLGTASHALPTSGPVLPM